MQELEAKEKLESLGFAVVDKNDLVCEGYRIIYREQYMNWAVERIDSHMPTGKTLTAGLMVFDSAIDAALALVGLLVGEGYS